MLMLVSMCSMRMVGWLALHGISCTGRGHLQELLWLAVCWGSAILSIGLVLLAVLLMSMIFLWFWGHETFDLSVETHGSLRDFAPKSCPDDAATSLATFPEQSPIGWHRADSMDGAQHVPECSLLYHGWRSLGCAAWRECFSFQNRDPGHLTTDRQWGHINPEYS